MEIKVSYYIELWELADSATATQDADRGGATRGCGTHPSVRSTICLCLSLYSPPPSNLGVLQKLIESMSRTVKLSLKCFRCIAL